METFDVAVVGGGPAGLAAALAVGRMNRRALVLEAGVPRTAHAPCYHNVLGFPDGIPGAALLALGRTQVERWGGAFREAAVTGAEATGRAGRERFRLETTDGDVGAAGIVLATGVKDRQPTCGPLYGETARGVHYCVVCDGRETVGERVAVVGRDDHAVEMVAALRDFTADVHLLLDGHEADLGRDARRRLAEWRVPVVPGALESAACGAEGVRFRIAGGGEIAFPHVFLALGVVPRTELAERLGCDLDDEGYLETDPFQRTSVEFVYAAGDCDGGHKQVTQAMADGERAALQLVRRIREADGPAAGIPKKRRAGDPSNE